MAVKGLLTLLLAAETKGFDRALVRSGQKISRYEKNLQMATKAVGLFGGAFAGLAILKDVGRRIVAFDKAMIGLSAILRTTRKDIKALEDQAISLGGSTIFTANQVGELQTILARFGFDQTEIENSTAAILDLAAAAGIDLSTAADTSAATLRAFGLETTEMGRVVDVMTSSFINSALTVETFGEAMKFAAPLAAAAGVTIEETAAMLGILADNGLRGSIAGTSLRRIFTELARTGKTMTQIFEEAGGDVNFLADALGFADDAVGKYALSSFIVLAKNAGLISENTAALYEAGVAANVAQSQLESLANKTLLLNSAWEGLVLTIEKGDGAFGSFVGNALEGLAEVLNALSGIEKEKDSIRDFEYYTGRKRNTGKTGNAVAGDVGNKLGESFKGLGITLSYLIKNMTTQGQVAFEMAKHMDKAREATDAYKTSLEAFEKGGVFGQGNVGDMNAPLKFIKMNEEATAELEKQAKIKEEAAKAKIIFDKDQQRLRELWQKQDDARNGVIRDRIALYDQELGRWVEIERLSLKVLQNEGGTRGDLIGNIVAGGKGGELTPMDNIDTEFSIPEYQTIIDKNKELSQSFATMSLAIGQSLASGSQSWEEYSSNLGETIFDIAANYALAAAAAATANAVESTSSIPWGFLAIPAVVGVALGLVKTSMNSAKSQSATAFADGGIVSSPTLGLVGEYAGASRNPEVIAPLSDLKNMLGDVGGATRVYGEFKLQNRVLVAAIERETNRANRYGA